MELRRRLRTLTTICLKPGIFPSSPGFWPIGGFRWRGAGARGIVCSDSGRLRSNRTRSRGCAGSSVASPAGRRRDGRLGSGGPPIPWPRVSAAPQCRRRQRCGWIPTCRGTTLGCCWSPRWAAGSASAWPPSNRACRLPASRQGTHRRHRRGQRRRRRPFSCGRRHRRTRRRRGRAWCRCCRSDVRRRSASSACDMSSTFIPRPLSAHEFPMPRAQKVRRRVGGSYFGGRQLGLPLYGGPSVGLVLQDSGG